MGLLSAASELEPLIFVLDDHRVVRDAIERLRANGYSVVSLSSAEELLARLPVGPPACLVLDVRLPGTSSLELQRQLAERGSVLPMVFITAPGHISVSVWAIEAGGMEFLPKPFSGEGLLSSIRQGLEEARRGWMARRQRQLIRDRYEQLTPRERQVLELVVSGLANKQVALELSIAEATVKIHRGHVMHKMRAGSLAELVRMADRIGVQPRNTESGM